MNTGIRFACPSRLLRFVEGPADSVGSSGVSDGVVSETADDSESDSSKSDSVDDSKDDSVEDEPLGEGGKKALQEERKRARDLNKSLAALRESYEALKGERDEARKAAEAAAAERDALKLTNERFAVAAAAGLPPVWADRLKGTTREELEADAKALAEMLPKGVGAVLPPDPSQGASSGGKGSGSVTAGRELYKELFKGNGGE